VLNNKPVRHRRLHWLILIDGVGAVLPTVGFEDDILYFVHDAVVRLALMRRLSSSGTAGGTLTVWNVC